MKSRGSETSVSESSAALGPSDERAEESVAGDSQPQGDVFTRRISPR